MNCNLLKEKIKEENINGAAVQLRSFDIFDTLITRTTAHPVGIFTVMQRILVDNQEYFDIPYFIRHNFRIIRVETECFTRKNKFITEKRQEITLREIYDAIKNNHNLSEEQIEKLINLEITTEIKNIRPVKRNINILKDLIKDGERVVLISDMYHTKDTIRHILLSVDNIFEDIPVYVSSLYGKTKNSGDLYKTVGESENVKPQNWIHYGDNKKSDIKQAKAMNICAYRLPPEEFKGYEQTAIGCLSEDFYVQSLIGLAKLTRIQSETKSKTYEFGCSFAAPILYNYVNWLVNQAAERGITCVHFVARDGYVLRAVADIIIKKKNLPVKTKYIYGSRTAWRIPCENNIEEYIHIICSEYFDRFSLEFSAKRLDIDVNVLQKYSGFKNTKIILKRAQIEELEKILKSSDEFKEYIIEANRKKKELLKKYLRQNLDLSSSAAAFADLSGSGRTMDILADIIKEFYKGEIICFYNYVETSAIQGRCNKISYMLSNKYRSPVFELLCRAPEGQTIGYKEIKNNIEPILEEIDNTKFQNWGFNDYIRGIKDFTYNACEFEILNEIPLLSYTLYTKYFDYLFKHPDKDTADILDSIPYTPVGNEYGTEYAPEYKFRHAFEYLISGKMKLNNDTGSGTFISLARSNSLMKKIHKFNQKYGTLRKFLININIHLRDKRILICIFGIKISLSWEKNEQ